MNEFVNRVLKPMMYPLVAGAFIAALVYSFSRILLAVPEAGSVVLASLVAAEVLGVGAVLAATSRIKPAQKGMLVVLAFALVAGGGVGAAIGEREFHHLGPEEVAFTITAVDIDFDLDRVQVPAGEPFSFELINQDAGIPHNLSIYPDARSTSQADALFLGEIFNGVATRIFEVPALDDGEYYFHCDVHPNMNGALIVGEGPPDEPTTDVVVRAKDIRFDRDELLLVADTEVTIEFHNDDAAIPHNIAIYPDAQRTREEDALFLGEIFNGVEVRTYTLPPFPAGEYFFHCDVHPNMRGTVIFR